MAPDRQCLVFTSLSDIPNPNSSASFKGALVDGFVRYRYSSSMLQDISFQLEDRRGVKAFDVGC
jgi:hypothetical protein